MTTAKKVMKKIMYLHGFASSGASGTVDLLRREFWERAAEDKRATVVAPDIPGHETPRERAEREARAS